MLEHINLNQLKKVSIRSMECKYCGMWEQMIGDDARDQSRAFKCVELLDNGEAKYECPSCQGIVESKSELVDLEW